MNESRGLRAVVIRLLQRWEIDRAVGYAVATRFWQFVAAPVTLFLIARYFSKPIQGYYYVFWSLIGLQTFLELNFYIVILSIASHEWERLELSARREITGDPDARSRLISLGRFIFGWYGVAAILFVLGVGWGGYWFLARQAVDSIDAVLWEGPWWALCLLTGIAIWLVPLNAILEGCNQVAAINRFQLIQAVCGNLVVWTCLPLGAGLWTPVAATAVRLICELTLVLGVYPRFFASFLRRPRGPVLAWKGDIWPMQWRVGLKGIFQYFTFYFVNPVIFHYHGAVAAGQMGMTWQILTTLQNACGAWVRTRAARFGMLVSAGRYRDLDHLYGRVARIAIGLLTLLGLAFIVAVGLLSWMELSLAERMLPLKPTIVFTVATVLGIVPTCQWIYIHAHKQSPFLLLSLFSSASTGLLLWWFGRLHGPMGAGLALLGIVGGFSVPVWTWAWYRCRKVWHSEL